MRGLCDSTSNKLSLGGRCAFRGSRCCRPGWWARLWDPVSVLSRVQLFATLWTVALRLLLCPWDSPNKNTGVGCHVLLQGIFLIKGSNPSLLRLLHCRQILYLLSRFRSPWGVGRTWEKDFSNLSCDSPWVETGGQLRLTCHSLGH